MELNWNVMINNALGEGFTPEELTDHFNKVLEAVKARKAKEDQLKYSEQDKWLKHQKDTWNNYLASRELVPVRQELVAGILCHTMNDHEQEMRTWPIKKLNEYKTYLEGLMKDQYEAFSTLTAGLSKLFEVFENPPDPAKKPKATRDMNSDRETIEDFLKSIL